MSSFTPTKVPQMHECRKERKRRTYRKSNQRAHRTHTTKYTPKFRKYHDCTLQVSHVHRCQVSARSNLHPEVSKCAQIQGLGLSKTTLRVSQCLPQSQTYTLQFPSLQNHLLSSQKVIKRHPESLYTHEVREFLTIQRPQCTRPNTHTTPRSILGSLIAFKIRTFQGKILHLGSSTSHRPRHR